MGEFVTALMIQVGVPVPNKLMARGEFSMAGKLWGLSEYESQAAYDAVTAQFQGGEEIRSIIVCLDAQMGFPQDSTLTKSRGFDFLAPIKISPYLLVLTNFSVRTYSFYMGKNDGSTLSSYDISKKMTKKFLQTFKSEPLNLLKQFKEPFMEISNANESFGLKMIFTGVQVNNLDEIKSFEKTIVTPQSLFAANNPGVGIWPQWEHDAYYRWQAFGINRDDPMYAIAMQLGSVTYSHLSGDPEILKLVDHLAIIQSQNFSNSPAGRPRAECPACREYILVGARKCSFCGTENIIW